MDLKYLLANQLFSRLEVRIITDAPRNIDAFIIYDEMKDRNTFLNIMHIFHSRENIKTCIFTAVKIQDLIFSRERNPKDWNYIVLFSIF